MIIQFVQGVTIKKGKRNCEFLPQILISNLARLFDLTEFKVCKIKGYDTRLHIIGIEQFGWTWQTTISFSAALEIVFVNYRLLKGTVKEK